MKNYQFQILRNVTFIYFASIFFMSCSKDNTDITDEKTAYKTIAVDFFENSKETIINSKMIDANYHLFINSLESPILKSDQHEKTYTLEELSVMFEINFGIPKENSMKFFNIAYENRELLQQENARELLIEALKLQLEYIISKDEVDEKWLFSALFTMLSDEDTHCSLQVLAHIADAMVLTAAAAITAPTGVGAVVAGTGVASSVAAATYVASNCN